MRTPFGARPLFPVLLAAAVAVAALPAAPTRAGEAAPAPPTGTLEVREGVPVLHVWGTPRERGFAQGWLLAKEIVGGMDGSLRAFFGDRTSVYGLMMLPLARNAFRFTDDERAELEGILAGIEARLPEEVDRRIGALDRPLELDDLRVANVFGDIYALGCASLAVWGSKTKDGQTLVARNFDFPALDLVVAHQHVRVVAPREGARGYVGISYPGSIGMLTCLNEDGVFAAIHDVHVKPGLLDLTQKNVPRLIALRRLMEQLPAAGAVERATALCRSWNTLYGNNFMVATSASGEGARAGVLEYDTHEKDDEGVDLREAQDGREYLCCTNHYRLRGEGSCWRYDTLTGACRADDPSPVTVDELFALASEAAFPDPDAKVARGQLGTLHQVVAETGARRLHVRMAGIGENIRTKRAVVFDVRRELAE